MPIDYVSNDGGNVRIFDGPNGMLCVVTAPALIPVGQRYTSHFATCPKADQARRKRQMTLERMARQAYCAYGDHVGWRNFAGLPMPDWDDLPDQIRIAWQVATRTAVSQVMTELQHAIYAADRQGER